MKLLQRKPYAVCAAQWNTDANSFELVMNVTNAIGSFEGHTLRDGDGRALSSHDPDIATKGKILTIHFAGCDATMKPGDWLIHDEDRVYLLTDEAMQERYRVVEVEVITHDGSEESSGDFCDARR